MRKQTKHPDSGYWFSNNPIINSRSISKRPAIHCVRLRIFKWALISEFIVLAFHNAGILRPLAAVIKSGADWSQRSLIRNRPTKKGFSNFRPVINSAQSLQNQSYCGSCEAEQEKSSWIIAHKLGLYKDLFNGLRSNNANWML